MKVKKGDKVKIIAGKDKGKEGKIIQVFPQDGTVVVEGLNVMKKHLRPQRRDEKGQRIELSSPVHHSNVQVIDPKSGKPTRVGYRLEGKTKKRVAKVSGEFLD